MEHRFEANRSDVAAAALLADALLRQSRVTGNGGLAARAEQALKQALDQQPGDYGAEQMLAMLYLSQHRFRQAYEVGERCRRARPMDTVNYGIIGDALVELGDYEKAFDVFDEMVRLRPGAASYARVAYARELQGNLAGALAAMKLAADAASGEDLESRAWNHAQLGELYLKLNQPREAQQEFAYASQAFPGYPAAVLGYARALEVQGDLAGASNLLKELASSVPSANVHARLGDLLALSGDAEAAQRQYALAEAAWRTDTPEPRNFARFLADRGRTEEAVRVAEEAAASRNDIFTADALAWAYYRAGKFEAAAEAIKQALRTGTKDRDILTHAAAIASARQTAKR